MNQQQLFLALTMTVLMTISGIREIRRGDNFGLGIFLLAVPGCFWMSRVFGEAV